MPLIHQQYLHLNSIDNIRLYGLIRKQLLLELILFLKPCEKARDICGKTIADIDHMEAERKIREGDDTRIIKGNQMIYNTKTKKWIVKNQSALKLKNSITKKVKSTFSLD